MSDTKTAHAHADHLLGLPGSGARPLRAVLSGGARPRRAVLSGDARPSAAAVRVPEHEARHRFPDAVVGRDGLVIRLGPDPRGAAGKARTSGSVVTRA